jgi:aryl-alcohol dehydrogenase-like predicted oxidoreductase
MANPFTSCTLLGFSRVEQVAENLKAIELLEKWDKVIEERLEKHLANAPDMPMEFRGWAKEANHRQLA